MLPLVELLFKSTVFTTLAKSTADCPSHIKHGFREFSTVLLSYKLTLVETESDKHGTDGFGMTGGREAPTDLSVEQETSDLTQISTKKSIEAPLSAPRQSNAARYSSRD